MTLFLVRFFILFLRASAGVLGVMVFLSAEAAARPPVSWTLEVSTGSAELDEGGEKAKAFVDASLSATTSFRDGEIYIAAYRIVPLGEDRDAFDEEIEFGLGYARPFSLGEWDISATWVTAPGDTAKGELEFGVAVEFDAPFTPLIEGKYNHTANEIGAQFSFGPEWQAGLWSLATRANAGFLSKENDDSLVYYGAEASATYAISTSIAFSPYVGLGYSDSEGFVREFRDGLPSERADSGFAFGVRLAVTR